MLVTAAPTAPAEMGSSGCCCCNGALRTHSGLHVSSCNTVANEDPQQVRSPEIFLRHHTFSRILRRDTGHTPQTVAPQPHTHLQQFGRPSQANELVLSRQAEQHRGLWIAGSHTAAYYSAWRAAGKAWRAQATQLVQATGEMACSSTCLRCVERQNEAVALCRHTEAACSNVSTGKRMAQHRNITLNP